MWDTKVYEYENLTIKISKFEEIIEANLKTFLPYFQQKFSRQHPRSLLINPSIRGERGQHWQTSTIFAEFFTIFPRFNNRRVFLYPLYRSNFFQWDDKWNNYRKVYKYMNKFSQFKKKEKESSTRSSLFISILRTNWIKIKTPELK